MDKIYLAHLEKLKQFAEKLPNTPMLAKAKVHVLTVLNMRYEGIMVDRNIDKHPYEYVTGFVKDAYTMLAAWAEVSFIENEQFAPIKNEIPEMEGKHHDLFQSLWVNFNEDEYTERIERYSYRLKINNLNGGWLNDKKCIDCGCGHGNFAHSLLKAGAKSVVGIDFGEESIAYAKKARDRLGVDPQIIDFRVESVYSIQNEDETFDFALQNGVFHHLDDEDTAYKEVYRVLKKNGWFWVYTDGAGGISYDLWDSSVYILRDVSSEFVLSCLDELNLKTGKRYHLGDSLKSTYRHHTWESITEKLSAIGFGNFRRIVGGYSTDFDHDVIDADKFGKEKFGSGDIRLLAQKVS